MICKSTRTVLPTPITDSLERILKMHDGKIETVRIQWPHFVTSFKPMLWVEWQDGHYNGESFILESNASLALWTGQILLALCRKSISPRVKLYDEDSGIVEFVIENE